MKNALILVLLFVITGCPFPVPRTGGRERTAGSFTDAERLLREGRYQQAHDEYQRIAKLASGSPDGEEALYRSARVLMASRNPGKNYSAALMELESCMHRYPSGRHADDAADLIAALDFSQRARLQSLLENVDALQKKLEMVTNESLQTAADRDRTARERDALRSERDNLATRVEGLLEERNELLRKRTALLGERSALVQDNSALNKKVEALKKENQKLFAAKKRLEKNILEITAIDVNMEKTRKKMK